MKIFIDTEFSSFHAPRLLSVGLVVEDGPEFYLELAGPHGSVSDFVHDTVLPQFGVIPGAAAPNPKELAQRLGAWLMSLLTAGGEESRVELLYDQAVDADLFESALKTAGLWALLESRMDFSIVGYINGVPEAIQAADSSWAASFAADGLDRHHALADARALRAAFEATHTNIGDGQFDAGPESGGRLESYAELSALELNWFERKLIRITEVMSDGDDDRGAPEGAPIVYIDCDDVLCLNVEFGGYDAIEAVRGRRMDASSVFAGLLHAPAVKVLRRAHEEMNGHVRYVVSSTWRQHVNRSEFAEILRMAGAAFIADNLESRTRWATPDLSESGSSRLEEIREWQREHGNGEPFVIIDDTFSGRSLMLNADDDSPFSGRIVICDERVGLLPAHVDDIVNALRMPLKPTGESTQ